MAEEKSKSTQPEEIAEGLEKSARILDLYLTVNVNLGKLTMTVNDICNLVPGSVIELDKKVDTPLDLAISNTKVVAKGEVVTIGENLGIRIVETN
ncbi:FliM/FliN family flagellar motor switch protein [Candidatus Omnitrophota bacterium]